jgi:ABC-type dipeptide/oligopeptide/nickel transport system permease component
VIVFLARRIVHSIPVLLAVLVLSFLIIRLAPGDPVTIMLGIHATPGAVAEAKRNLGLDRSLGHQLAVYLVHSFEGNFGDSIVKQASVRSIVSSRIAPSLYLIVYAVVLALLLTFPLAVLSTVKRNRVTDQLIRVLGMTVFAMPSFWLGLMLGLLFGLELHVLPVSGYDSDPIGLLRTLLLPALTLALFLAPMLIRTLRASLVEAVGTEYVEAARARGLSEVRVLGLHAMRNSLIPLITVLSINIGFLLSGTVVIENVFQVPGLGSLLVQSVLTRDYPVIQALVFVFGVMVIVTNLLADVAYWVADPRIRFRRAS